jgi:hypothetical protein
MQRASYPQNMRKVSLFIDRLYLSVSFQCQLKAIIETNRTKINSSVVPFDLQRNEAIFNQKLSLECNPKSSRGNFLKITLVILKDKSTKMVGRVEINLDNDPIRSAGGNKYVLKRCPQKNVKLKLGYDYGMDGMRKTVDIFNLIGRWFLRLFGFC